MKFNRSVVGNGQGRSWRFFSGSAIVVAAMITAGKANAGFSLGDSANFTVLFEAGEAIISVSTTALSLATPESALHPVPRPHKSS
jgi:hypothetical protein